MPPAAVLNGAYEHGYSKSPVSTSINEAVRHKTPLTNGAHEDTTSLATAVKLNGTTNGVHTPIPGNASKIPRLKISNDYTVSENPIGTIRPVRIICIGAGASGVNLAYQVQRNMKNTDLAIYEKNPAIGGTWYENRYPGCKCDIRRPPST